MGSDDQIKLLEFHLASTRTDSKKLQKKVLGALKHHRFIVGVFIRSSVFGLRFLVLFLFLFHYPFRIVLGTIGFLLRCQRVDQ